MHSLFSTYAFAFGMTLIAGLATGIGGVAVLKIKQSNIRYLAMALGLSAGVMIYVSFMELMPQAEEFLVQHYGQPLAGWMLIVGFFAGIALIAIIDRLVPEPQNPHEPCSLEELKILQGDDFDPETVNPADFDCSQLRKKQNNTIIDESGNLADSPEVQAELYRTGLFSALAIAIHNFPEGLATFMSAVADPALGLTIAVAIAIHNIPEGISVAVPIYYATGSRGKAIGYALLSGIAEPLGALVGALILLPFLNDAIMGFVFAAVAGIMVYISIDELLPTAEKYGEHHYSIYGLIAGMAIMAISLQAL